MKLSRHGPISLLAAISSVVLLAATLPTVASAAGVPGSERGRPSRPHDPRRPHGDRVTSVDTLGTYSGQAIGAKIKVVLPLPSTRIYADTGVLATAGGSISASLASITDAMFSSGPVACNSQGNGTLATSVSTMERLSAFVATPAALTCTSVRADSRASCVGASGSSTLTGLVFAGVSVVVTGAANQSVSIPGVATLVINEQIMAAGAAGITVNALHVTLATGDELIVCSSHSDIECTTPTRSSTWGAVKEMYR